MKYPRVCRSSADAVKAVRTLGRASRLPQLFARKRQFRFQPNGFLEESYGVLESPLQGKYATEVLVQRRHVGCQRQCKMHLRFGLAKPLLFHQCMPQQSQMLHRARIQEQEIAAYFFGAQWPVGAHCINRSTDSGIPLAAAPGISPPRGLPA